jgi:hypothetical protein
MEPILATKGLQQVQREMDGVVAELQTHWFHKNADGPTLRALLPNFTQCYLFDGDLMGVFYGEDTNIDKQVRRPLRPFWRPICLRFTYMCNVCSCQNILRRNGRGQELLIDVWKKGMQGSASSPLHVTHKILDSMKHSVMAGMHVFRFGALEVEKQVAGIRRGEVRYGKEKSPMSQSRSSVNSLDTEQDVGPAKGHGPDAGGHGGHGHDGAEPSSVLRHVKEWVDAEIDEDTESLAGYSSSFAVNSLLIQTLRQQFTHVLEKGVCRQTPAGLAGHSLYPRSTANRPLSQTELNHLPGMISVQAFSRLSTACSIGIDMNSMQMEASINKAAPQEVRARVYASRAGVGTWLEPRVAGLGPLPRGITIVVAGIMIWLQLTYLLQSWYP